MGFDFLRSCYRTFATLYSDSDTPVAVRWYWCDSDAQAYPFPHFMNSLNWGEETGIEPGEEVGSGRPWNDGRNTSGGSGQMFCGDPQWMVTGIPIAEPPANPLSCCGLHGVGGFVLEGEVELFHGPLLDAGGAVVVAGEVGFTTGPPLGDAGTGFTIAAAVALSTDAFRPTIGDGAVLTGEVVLEIDDMLPGMIVAYGGSSIPSGYLLCDGSSLLRSAYPALFGVIGTAFGSMDSTHFNIPKLIGRVPVGQDPSGLVLPILHPSIGDFIGEERHVLVTNEMPIHRHSFGGGAGTSPWVLTGSSVWNVASGGLTATTLPMDDAGGGLAHNNVQPSQAVNYIIKT